MSELKEFQGKNLDEAIEAACKHYELKRDKLEIEIVSGGSSGIFGLVGVKKAVVRAKPRGSFKSAAEAPERPERQERRPERADKPEKADRSERSERSEQAERPEQAPRREADRASSEAKAPRQEAASQNQAEAKPEAKREQAEGDEPRRSRRGRGRGRGERSGSGERSDARGADKPAERTSDVDGNRADGNRQEGSRADGNRVDGIRLEGNRGPAPRRRERPRREAEGNRAPRADSAGPLVDDDDSGAPKGIGHLDQALLEEVAREVTGKLLEHLVENAKVAVELLPDRVCVRIEDPDNTGLLIGREGQTLASIQYLVNRLVSKRMDASVRVQIDAGDYRESQDERLRQIARHLADKAMSSGRTQSTRPMSSYHRRVVHLTLQDDEHVFTRSKGEGSMKRVLIMSKRKGKNGEMVEEIPQDAAQEFNDDNRD
ncbi:Jag family protein [Humidesulfovibrio sp.]